MAARKHKTKFFFLNDELHKLLRVNRPHDIAEAWNYEQHKRVVYIWSMVKKNWAKAYRTTEVAKIVDRDVEIVKKYIYEGGIPEPPRSYVIGSDPKRYGWHRWADKHVIQLHEYMLTKHAGRPRKDGKITPMYRTPTRKEILALLRDETIVYVKTSSGDFVPAWNESEF